MTFRAEVKTTNPLNASRQFSVGAARGRHAQRKKQRELLKLLTAAHVRIPKFPLTVTITRVAPSNGLDPHDGLGAALKGVIDGIADGLGLTNDRDERVTWKLEQRRGRPKEYCVEVCVG